MVILVKLYKICGRNPGNWTQSHRDLLEDAEIKNKQCLKNTHDLKFLTSSKTLKTL